MQTEASPIHGADEADFAAGRIENPSPDADADADAESGANPPQVASAPPAVRPASLDAALIFGGDMVIAHFDGMRSLPRHPTLRTPFHWTASADHPPADALAPIPLGMGERGCLHVDLALAPRVITVNGDAHVRHEIGAELVNRLTAPGRTNRRHTVVVAGQPVNPDFLMHSPVRTAGLAEFDPHRVPPGTEICFLVCRLSRPDDAAVIQQLITTPMPRIVPILIDEVSASDWSLFALPEGRALAPSEKSRSA